LDGKIAIPVGGRLPIDADIPHLRRARAGFHFLEQALDGGSISLRENLNTGVWKVPDVAVKEEALRPYRYEIAESDPLHKPVDHNMCGDFHLLDNAKK
jgi:hypothetical protein